MTETRITLDMDAIRKEIEPDFIIARHESPRGVRLDIQYIVPELAEHTPDDQLSIVCHDKEFGPGSVNDAKTLIAMTVAFIRQEGVAKYREALADMRGEIKAPDTPPAPTPSAADRR